MNRYRLYLYLLVIFLLLGSVLANADEKKTITDKIKAILQRENISDKVSITAIDIGRNYLLLDINAGKLSTPASVQKILTSIVALDMLGVNFRFQTDFLGEGISSDYSDIKTLYVKGGGDPTFTIEDLLVSVRALVRKGIKHIGTIIIDDTKYSTRLRRQGQRAYQAGTSALSLNFNTIEFEICPDPHGGKSRISHEPIELPLTLTGEITSKDKNVMTYKIDEVKGIGRIEHYRAQGAINKRAKCVRVYRAVENPAYMFGKTLAGALQRYGVRVDIVRKGTTNDAQAKLIYSHQSKPLSLIVRDLNHYSNNMIANELVYAIGSATPNGSNADVDQFSEGLKTIREHLRRFGIDTAKLLLIDGSGLNGNNRLTSYGLAMALRHAYLDPRISFEFVSSLPIGGVSGTLKDRFRNLKQAVVRAKTGTIKGVSSLAGYVFSRTGKIIAFAIIFNGVKSPYDTKDIEDRVVSLLAGI